MPDDLRLRITSVASENGIASALTQGDTKLRASPLILILPQEEPRAISLTLFPNVGVVWGHTSGAGLVLVEFDHDLFGLILSSPAPICCPRFKRRQPVSGVVLTALSGDQ